MFSYYEQAKFCRSELLAAIARGDSDAAYYWTVRLAVWCRPERYWFAP